MMCSKSGASLWMTGTISSPPLTGKVPPWQKSFWTSMTRRTSRTVICIHDHGSDCAGPGPCLLLEEAFHVEPLGEAVDPLVRGQVVFSHSEAVAAFGEHVQFGGLVSGDPLLVERDADRSQAEVIVGGRGDKHGWRVGGNNQILEILATRIDGRDECRAAARLVLEGNACR